MLGFPDITGDPPPGLRLLGGETTVDKARRAPLGGGACGGLAEGQSLEEGRGLSWAAGWLTEWLCCLRGPGDGSAWSSSGNEAL